MNGYVNIDTNRYSVPERLVGKQVEIHKSWQRLSVFFGDKKVADHPRCIDRRDPKIKLPGHHTPFAGKKNRAVPQRKKKCSLVKAPPLIGMWLN